MELLPESASRAALPIGGSAVALALALPQTPEYWNIGSATMPMVPITTMGVMFAIVMLAWTAFGTEMHPITAKARGVEPPPGNTFQVLGLTGPIFASAALAFGMHALPVAGTSIEAMHCLLPFALWYVDVALLKWLNPHVEWPEEATSLSANYKAEHATPVSAALQLLGVFMFEVYVQQMLGAGLSLSGWPLLGVAGLIATSAGVVNHALANGLLNGILCGEFYWTVSLMFGLSNSALPVGIYHHLMYSMPNFVAAYDEAVDTAPSPVAHALLLHGTLGVWHAALFAFVSTLGMPTAMELQPALGFPNPLPDSPVEGFGLACLVLFGSAAVATAAAAARAGRDPRAL